MICGCVHIGDSKTRTSSRAFVPVLPLEVFSVIPRLAFFGSRGGGKNHLRCLRQSSSFVLRPQTAQGAGSVLRGHARLPGDRGPARVVPELRQGEAGRTVVVGRQSLLHQALRLLRGSPLPGFDHLRCCPGTASGLEDGQGTRQAVYAGAIAQNRKAWAKGHRH